MPVITSASLDEFTIPLRTRLATAKGTISERTGVVLTLVDEQGHVGRGEIAPLPGWSSVGLDSVRSLLGDWVDATLQSGTTAPLASLAPEARAGIDTALWWLRATLEGRPLWQSISLEGDPRVAVNALLAASTPGDLALEAEAAQTSGFTALKVKVGTGNDRSRLESLAGSLTPNTVVRLDANGSWSIGEATEMAGLAAELLGARLEYIEDPVGSLDELELLRPHVEVPVAADELAANNADLARVLDLVDVVVLKPPLVGGITESLEVATTATQAGVDVVISSLLDGPVGLGAWCHLAAAIGGDRAHGLGTAPLLDHPQAAALVPRSGTVVLDARPS